MRTLPSRKPVAHRSAVASGQPALRSKGIAVLPVTYYMLSKADSEVGCSSTTHLDILPHQHSNIFHALLLKEIFASIIPCS
jgi:hypothetical protein